MRNKILNKYKAAHFDDQEEVAVDFYNTHVPVLLEKIKTGLESFFNEHKDNNWLTIDVITFFEALLNTEGFQKEAIRTLGQDFFGLVKSIREDMADDNGPMLSEFLGKLMLPR